MQTLMENGASCKLGKLLKQLPGVRVEGPASVEITGLAYDSRRVQPGFLFAALHGNHEEGARFVDNAVRHGAVAILSHMDHPECRHVTRLVVEDPRAVLADLSSLFYGEPSRHLKVVGITGTNGKTTTSFMVQHILQTAGWKTGLIGTIQYEIGERIIPAARTTPEAPDIQVMLAKMLKNGAQAAAMEVSSHGLALNRVRATDFAVGVFTNLTRDHLDFHKTMEAYFAAKKRLFLQMAAQPSPGLAVLNLDDPYGRQLAGADAPPLAICTYGLHAEAQVRAENIEASLMHSRFRLQSPWGTGLLELPLAGAYNISNALAAISACGSLGIPLDAMAEALAGMPAVPGRLERIADLRDRFIFVDYAHTDDALDNVLRMLRQQQTKGHLLVVFGCGGNRDMAKRPLMGAVAARWADYTLVTSDNPRHEDPHAIIAQIVAGMPPGTAYGVEPDREKALRQALSMAAPGDTLLVAGKGHETCQELAHTTIPFDDREILKRLLLEETLGS